MSDLPDELSTLAGEYVMGLLDAAETEAVRQRASRDPGLASVIAAWEVMLAPLANVVPPVEPPASLWARIATSVAPLPMTPANDAGFARPGLFRRAGFWAATTVLSTAVAAALAAIAFLPPESLPAEVRELMQRRAQPLLAGPAPPPPPAVAPVPPEPPRQVATVVPSQPDVRQIAAIASLKGPGVMFLAELRPDGTVKVIAVGPTTVPRERDLELWVLPRGETRPKSLGVLPPGGRNVDKAPVPEDSQLLVSLEPRGGSPTGRPTGPVLYGGTLVGL